MELISQGEKALRDNLKEDKLRLLNMMYLTHYLFMSSFIFHLKCKLHERAFVYFSHCCNVSVRNILQVQ